jgi:hypothetical protein
MPTIRSAAASGSGGTLGNVVAPSLTWKPGDLVLISGFTVTTAATWFQTGGTGVWSFHEQQSATGGQGVGSFAAWRTMQAGDALPSFTKTSGGGVREWAAIAITPDTGSYLFIDAWAATTVDSVASTSHTPGAATASGSGEISVIFNLAAATAVGVNAFVMGDASGWTQQAASAYGGGAAATANWIDVAARTGVSGTVTPGAESTGAVSTNAVIYHCLVSETTTAPVVLVNDFLGGTIGATLTPASTGGSSGNAFDGVDSAGATVVFDATHAYYTGVAAKLATGGTGAAADFYWSSSLTVGGNPAQLYFRALCYFTANPSADLVIAYASHSGTRSAALVLASTGYLKFINTAGTTIFFSGQVIPLNSWFRVEGRITCSATQGQVELLVFDAPTAIVPSDATVSALSQNTGTAIDTMLFGNNTAAANTGPYWVAYVGASTSGYLGPVGVIQFASEGAQIPNTIPCALGTLASASSQTAGNGWEFKIRSHADYFTLVAELPQINSFQMAYLLSDKGSGSLVLNEDDPALFPPNRTELNANPRFAGGSSTGWSASGGFLTVVGTALGSSSSPGVSTPGQALPGAAQPGSPGLTYLGGTAYPYALQVSLGTQFTSQPGLAQPGGTQPGSPGVIQATVQESGGAFAVFPLQAYTVTALVYSPL